MASARSIPVQNDLPSPARTTHLTSLSYRTSCQISRSSSCIFWLMALWTCGRLSVTQATPSSLAYSTVSKSVTGGLYGGLKVQPMADVSVARTSSPFIADIGPVTESDDELRAILDQAELLPLLPALAYATGDLSLLRDELRPDPLMFMLPGAGLTDEQAATI